MSNTIKIKRRLATSQAGAGAPAVLENGELAYNEVDNILYYGDVHGQSRKIAGNGAYVTLGDSQTIIESKTFTANVDLGSSAYSTTKPKTDSSSYVATTEFVQNVASLLDGGSF